MSPRTVERAVEPWRWELRNAALATVRFETPPGRQLWADFGQCLVSNRFAEAKGCLCHESNVHHEH